MKTRVTIKYVKSVKLVLIMLLAFVLSMTSMHAQSSVTVYTIQNIGFGAFATGNTGGTVKVSSSGVRTVTGTVIPLNFGLQYRPAIFEIEAPSGIVISFANSLNATLTGSNGGTMSVRLTNQIPYCHLIQWLVLPHERNLKWVVLLPWQSDPLALLVLIPAH